MIYNLLNINVLISKWVTLLTKNKKLKKILVYVGLSLVFQGRPRLFWGELEVISWKSDGTFPAH